MSDGATPEPPDRGSPRDAGADGRGRRLEPPRDLPALLDRLEELMASLDELDERARAVVYGLLDGIDRLHRTALRRLGAELGAATVEDLRAAHPAIAWLWEAYGVGLDERAAAEAALDEIRPYIRSHGGGVEVLDVADGRVHVELSGACSGCTASAITLQRGVEEALRDHFPGFRELTVEEDDAEPHAPPGPTLLQIEAHPDSSLGRR